jgi:small-conductance mechanosensitive channel
MIDMLYAIFGVLALVLALISQLAPLRLLRHLRAAFCFVGVSCVALWAVSYLDNLEWLEWARIALLATIGYLIARSIIVVIFEYLLTRRIGIEVPRLARDVVAILIYLVTAATVLRSALGVEVGALLATSAVLTVVVGLALQETLGTLLAGLALAWEKRLQTGQWIEIDGLVGRVEELGWRSLIICTRFGEQILIPNSNVSRSRLRLLGRGNLMVAVPIHLGVAYGVAPDRAKQVLLRVAQGVPGALADPPPRVLVQEYADSAVVYECRLWTREPWLDADLRDELLTRSHAALARAGMEIPFPQRTVHMARRASVDHTAKIEKALGQCELFTGLSEHALKTLAERSHWHRFAPGEIIMLEGDDSRAMFVVADGEAVIELAGRRLNQLNVGDTFGEIAFLTGEPRTATVRAHDVLYVVEIASDALGALVEEQQHLADDLACRVAARQDLLAEQGKLETSPDTRKGLVASLRDGLLRLVGAGGSAGDRTS